VAFVSTRATIESCDEVMIVVSSLFIDYAHGVTLSELHASL
jgi:hypothetical protein